MPEITAETEYIHYTNKIRYYFDKIKKQKNVSDYFIIKLLFLAFKYEILFYFFLGLLFEIIDFLQIILM